MRTTVSCAALIVVLSWLATASVASALPTTGLVPCVTACSGSYSGKITATKTEPYTGHGGTVTTSTIWTWHETMHDRGSGKSEWTLDSSTAQGAITYSDYPTGNCTFTSSLRPDADARFRVTYPDGTTAAADAAAVYGPRHGPDDTTVTDYAQNGTPTDTNLDPSGAVGYLAGGTPPQNEMQTAVTCGGPTTTQDGVPNSIDAYDWNSAVGDAGCHFHDYSKGETVFFPASTSAVTVTSECTGVDDRFGVTTDAHLSESFTFQGSPTPSTQPGATPSSPNPSLPGPVAPPTNTDVRKRAAAQDLKGATDDAIVPCTAVALGSLAGAQRGGLLTGLAKGEDASSPESLPDAGDRLAGSWRDLCDQAAARIQHDVRTAVDPPRDDFHVLARLVAKKTKKPAACSRGRSATRALCRLERDQKAVLSAARDVTAAAAAVQTTIERETAALTARDSATAAAQSANAAQLGRKMDAAIAAQHTAAKARAADLRALGLRLAPTKKAAAKGRALLVSRLAKRGVTVPQLRPFIGTALG